MHTADVLRRMSGSSRRRIRRDRREGLEGEASAVFVVNPVKIDKTVYEKKEANDGKRILVMRFWPRGVRKTAIDLWMRDVGTSPDLIKDWKSGKVTRAEYVARYNEQMEGEQEKKLLAELREYANEGTITLLCSDKDPNKCHRSLLKDMIEKGS